MIGKKNNRGFPGKNTYKVLGRPLCEYPLIAAKKSKFIDQIYVSTDCEKIKKIMPIKSWGGCDVDYKWQIPGVESWLKVNGHKKKEITKIDYNQK